MLPAFAFDDNGDQLSLVTNLGRLQSRTIASGSTKVGPHVDLTTQWLTPAALAEFSLTLAALAVVPSNRLLVKVYDAKTGSELTALSGLSAPATFVSLSEDGSRAAASGLFAKNAVRWREVKVWDAINGQILLSSQPSNAPTPYTYGRVAMSPDGSRIAFDDYDYSAGLDPGTAAAFLGTRVKICEVPGGRELFSLPIGKEILFSVAYSPDGRLLATGDSTGKTSVWDAQTGSILYSAEQAGPVFRFAFSPDSRRLAGADREKVQIWNAVDGQEVLVLRGAQPRPLDGGFNPALAWSRDGQQLASLNWDGSISIWSAAPQLPGPTERWKEAGGRVFAWHLAEAEAAVNQAQTRAAEFHVNRLSGRNTSRHRHSSAACSVILALRQLGSSGHRLRSLVRRRRAGRRPRVAKLRPSADRRGDYDRYRRLCKRLIDAFEQQVNPQMAFCAAQTIGLAPGPPIQARKVISLVDRAIPLERRHAEIDFALALVYLRVEEFDRAAILLHKFTDREPDRAGARGPCSRSSTAGLVAWRN